MKGYRLGLIFFFFVFLLTFLVERIFLLSFVTFSLFFLYFLGRYNKKTKKCNKLIHILIWVRNVSNAISWTTSFLCFGFFLHAKNALWSLCSLKKNFNFAWLISFVLLNVFLNNFDVRYQASSLDQIKLGQIFDTGNVISKQFGKLNWLSDVCIKNIYTNFLTSFFLQAILSSWSSL